ncbi:MAG: cell division protein FtsL [Pararhodobacter sp.]|nr:cell division protein FtsL [Pararhodobacter sp.]
MRSLLYLMTALGVMALAVWAYHENHRTQQARADMRAVEREIEALRAALSMQRAEWAYLNRPDRLRQLVDMNFTRLRLMPMTVEQYGHIGEIVYPPMPPVHTPGAYLGTSVETLGTIDHTIGTDPAEAP